MINKCEENTWVSVKDKLPSDHEYVLVYAHMNGTGAPCPISIARCIKGEWELLCNCDTNSLICRKLPYHIEKGDITHWMKFPVPPDRKWVNL